MTDRCKDKTFYAGGAKVASGQATYNDPVRGELSVVCGQGPHTPTTIHISALPEGATLSFFDAELEFHARAATGRRGRNGLSASREQAKNNPEAWVATIENLSPAGYDTELVQGAVLHVATALDADQRLRVAAIGALLNYDALGVLVRDSDPAIATKAAIRLRELAALDFCQESQRETPHPLRIASGTSLYRSGEEIVRVAKPGRSAMDSAKLVAIAKLYDTYGVPVVLPTSDPTTTADGDELTTWGFVDNDPTKDFPAEDVGTILSRLHSIPLDAVTEALGSPPPELAAAAARGRGRVEALASDPQGFGIDPQQITNTFNELEAAFVKACEQEPQVLLHGDLNPGNVLWGVSDPVLCDFEACTTGPWVWDLVNTQLEVAIDNQPASDLVGLIEGYGKDPKTSPAWAPLCRLRALNRVTFFVTEAAAGSEAGNEAEKWVAWMNAGFPGLPEL